MKILDIMTDDPVTIGPGESIRQAESLMDEHNIRQLPVTKGRQILGIITDRDIRSYVSGSLRPSADDWDRAMNTEVSTVMTTQPITIAPDDDLSEAIEILLSEKIGAIPVVDDTEGVVGILSYMDVLRCYLDQLQEN